MPVRENFPLKDLNTFGVESNARWYTDIIREEDLKELFADKQWSDHSRLVLGGGSNMLFTGDFMGLVIHMNIHGVKHEIKGDYVYVTAGGGEVWNDLVNYCVDRQFAGMENLSLIPGSVGASPIQNIGAYGVELQDIFHSCRAFEISTGSIRTFKKQDCQFSYRDSVFKSAFKGKYIITEVTFKLSKNFTPNVTYSAIQHELDKLDIIHPTIKDISKLVSHIRVSKLPDPGTIGNAGSFFKNPIVMVDKFVQLQSNFPDIAHFPAADGYVKLSAGWLIEQCGWKGKIVGNTGTWKNQALVIVNHGKATGNEIFKFSGAIIDTVKTRFGVLLEREVNVV